MALNAREQINGNSPQDLNKLNNNFMSVWKTLFGGLDFSDTNNNLKKKIQTQQIPVQGEGNFDKNFPLSIRFFVPSNTKSITSTSFNMICERYRMDSGVTSGGGGIVGGDISLSMSSANVGVASISSPTVGVSSISSASGSGSTTSLVSRWYPYSENGLKGSYFRPGNRMLTKDVFLSLSRDGNMYYGDVPGGHVLGALSPIYSEDKILMDLSALNHEHDVSISIAPHSHNISMSPHSHDITLQPHSHTGSANINIPDHNHSLNEGIQVSKQDAQGVNIKMNGTVIATMDSISANTKNNIDCKDLIKIGQWNTIECTTSNLARLTIYGIIELVMNY